MSDTPITDDMDPRHQFAHRVLHEVVIYVEEGHMAGLEETDDMTKLEDFGNWLANKFLAEPDIINKHNRGEPK
jgi:hypothetical protein